MFESTSDRADAKAWEALAEAAFPDTYLADELIVEALLLARGK